MKRSKWKQRGNEYARKWAMNYKERRRLADVLELQLAESNKEKRITTKTVTHNQQENMQMNDEENRLSMLDELGKPNPEVITAIKQYIVLYNENLKNLRKKENVK